MTNSSVCARPFLHLPGQKLTMICGGVACNSVHLKWFRPPLIGTRVPTSIRVTVLGRIVNFLTFVVGVPLLIQRSCALDFGHQQPLKLVKPQCFRLSIFVADPSLEGAVLGASPKTSTHKPSDVSPKPCNLDIVNLAPMPVKVDA